MSERNYTELYQKMTQGIKTERDTKRLNFINNCLTWVFYIMYPGLLLDTLFMHREVFLKVLLIPAATFIVVSLIRTRINEPRPYEVEDIIPLIKKDTKGKSMPSRHVLSVSDSVAGHRSFSLCSLQRICQDTGRGSLPKGCSCWISGGNPVRYAVFRALEAFCR